MSFASFKPVLMLAQLVLRARKELVAAQFCNLNIGVGLETKGTKLTINTMGAVSVVDTPSTPMTYAETGSASADLEITMDKTVAVKLDDSDKAQVEAGGATLEQAYGARMIYELQDYVDALVLGKYTECTVENYESGSTAWQWGTTPAASEIAKFFAGVHKSMDDANCEKDGRFIVLPNIAIQGIRIGLGSIASDLGDEVVRAGLQYKNLHGFQVFQSPNCVTASSVIHGMAGNMPNVGDGVPGCVALAVQISPNVEKLRLEGYWADGIRARVTGGALVFKPDRCVDINLNESLLA